MKNAASFLGICGAPADLWLNKPAFEVLDQALHFVSRHEAHELHAALAAGRVPADLERKLTGLDGHGIQNHHIAQSSRLLIALLLAAYAGDFAAASAAERDRLLQALAYVRKDEDVIPDFTPGGFTDDYQVIRAVGNRFAHLINTFKAWRLRCQVPAMWKSHSAPLVPLPGHGSVREHRDLGTPRWHAGRAA